mmetsp:Transcript_29471/g.43483  ORF Transcript_29471/g.43483 Transcript_29471/m.43483 type:complete len:91 (+) Transcript_29471:194-466(+)
MGQALCKVTCDMPMGPVSVVDVCGILFVSSRFQQSSKQSIMRPTRSKFTSTPPETKNNETPQSKFTSTQSSQKRIKKKKKKKKKTTNSLD